MRIDEARRDDAALGVIDRPGTTLVGAGRLHGGDAATGNPDLALRQDPLRIGREHTCAPDDEIGSGAAGSDVGEAPGLGGERRDGEAGEPGHEVILLRDQ